MLQRLCIARLFLRKPKFALLDEATASVPEAFETEVYERLAADGVTCITVAHRVDNLVKFHTQQLRLDAEGNAVTEGLMS